MENNKASSPLVAAALHHPRRYGWGLTTLAAVIVYALMLVPYTWWSITVTVLAIVLISACASICYLAVESKCNDLWFAAVITLASPALLTILAMMIFL